MNSETVDLIATDPPFNTKRNRSGEAGHYVDNWKWGDTGILPDQWKWNEVHPKWLEEIFDDNLALYHVIDATRTCHGEDIAAFLCFLSVRLLEMHRVLKPTGSIYLHCDHTANSYIRMCMDAIFGKKQFQNEIIWCYKRMANGRQRMFNKTHDTIFWYTKGDSWAFNVDDVRLPYAESSLDRSGYAKSSLGGGAPSSGVCELNSTGRFPEDWWDIPIIRPNAGERTGSPDQKPLELYERIIKASSNEGDLVLDPFCGCATTLIAARNLKRRWVGIDRRPDARWHVVTRLAGMDKKERERLENFAIDPGWLGKQMAQYEAHYQKTPPVRTDEGATASSPLEHVFPVTEEHTLRHKDMLKILADKFGVKCWGCGFVPPDDRYLHLDHITPKSEGGSNDLDNRALLCGPCNNKKSNKLTLTGLWKANTKDSHMREPNPIDLAAAQRWTRQELLTRIRTANHQLNLEGR